MSRALPRIKKLISLPLSLARLAAKYTAIEERDFSDYIADLIRRDLESKGIINYASEEWREKMAKALARAQATGEPLAKAIEFYDHAKEPIGEIAAGHPRDTPPTFDPSLNEPSGESSPRGKLKPLPSPPYKHRPPKR